MNDPLEKADAGAGTGKPIASPVEIRPAANAGGNVPRRMADAPALPAVPIGTAGYKFKFPAESPQGQDERREHERIRKANRRDAARTIEPPPLPAPSLVDAPQAPTGEQSLVAAPSPGAVVSDFLPWQAEDVKDFTDEMVDLTEAKRIGDFVNMAREANLPPKLCIEIERDAKYPTTTKAGLKRALAGTAAKWLNKSGISARNKEEAALLFCVVTLKLQGLRLRTRLKSLIEADKPKPTPRVVPLPERLSELMANPK